MTSKRQFVGSLTLLGVALANSRFAFAQSLKTTALVEARDVPVKFDVVQSGFIPWWIRSGISATTNIRPQNWFAEEMPKFKQAGYDPGGVLTATVTKILGDAGITVSILKDLARSADSINYVDYSKIKHESDAIVHIAIEEIAFEYPRGAEAFWPKISSWISVLDKAEKKK
jgi:hypothetical protein